MEKKDRLAKAIAYLKLQGLVESQVDAARKMNASESTMSSAIRGNEKYLNNTFLRRFNDAFGGIFSLKWLIDGIGNMLNGCGCSADTDTDDSFYHPSQKRTTSEPEAKEERRTSEDLLARENELLRQQVQFLKEQVEFYKNKK